MTENTSVSRAEGGAAWRVVISVLLVAVMVALVLVLTPLASTPAQRGDYQAAQPSFAPTATALAADQASPERLSPKSRVGLAGARCVPDQYAAAGTPAPELPTVAPTARASLAGTPPPLPTLFIYSGPDQSGAAPTAIPTAVPPLDRQGNDLMNILLIGNDGEVTHDGTMRTDSMIVVSVNRTTGTVSLLSLPRDLYVYVPSWTMQRLNTAWGYGEAVGWTDGGFGLMRQTLFYNLGINVHHYAMVDLTGFKALVDSVGGVRVAVDCAISGFAADRCAGAGRRLSDSRPGFLGSAGGGVRSDRG